MIKAWRRRGRRKWLSKESKREGRKWLWKERRRKKWLSKESKREKENGCGRRGEGKGRKWLRQRGEGRLKVKPDSRVEWSKTIDPTFSTLLIHILNSKPHNKLLSNAIFTLASIHTHTHQ